MGVCTADSAIFKPTSNQSEFNIAVNWIKRKLNGRIKSGKFIILFVIGSLLNNYNDILFSQH